jgi:hypothetical protein
MFPLQDVADMAPLVTMLKLKLGAFGWHEALRREQRHYEGTAEVVAELDEYLERMGIRCDCLKHII